MSVDKTNVVRVNVRVCVGGGECRLVSCNGITGMGSPSAESTVDCLTAPIITNNLFLESICFISFLIYVLYVLFYFSSNMS